MIRRRVSQRGGQAAAVSAARNGTTWAAYYSYAPMPVPSGLSERARVLQRPLSMQCSHGAILWSELYLINIFDSWWALLGL